MARTSFMAGRNMGLKVSCARSGRASSVLGMGVSSVRIRFRGMKVTLALLPSCSEEEEEHSVRRVL
jgi:hypothetical protein